MSSPLPTPPAPLEAGQVAVTRCTVSDGVTDTPYRRAGRGAPVVVLAAAESRAEGALLATLPHEFRLILPDVPVLPVAARDESLAFPGWLRGFLDGLGLGGVAIVAEERFGAAALGFALLEPERVERLVFLLDGVMEVSHLGAVADSLRTSGVPVLVSWLAADAAASAAEIGRFLATVAPAG